MHRNWLLIIVPLCAVVGSGCSSRLDSDLRAGVIGDALSGSLDAADMRVASLGRYLEYELFEPAFVDTSRNVDSQMCDEVRLALREACEAIVAAGYESCSPRASFFYANLVPRCSARINAAEWNDVIMREVWAFDLSGEPYDGHPPECGNGLLEPGEQCDDGGNALWDGCDSACFFETFSGCEAAIEYHFARREVALVDQALWDGPHSHMLRHENAIAIRDVNRETCIDARRAAIEVCYELTATMPFVDWCRPNVELFEDDRDPACAVRFWVGFRSIDPDAGVYTLNLEGILAFTIR